LQGYPGIYIYHQRRGFLMIITEFPLFGLLYIRTKLLWTLPGFCYILISEKNTACIQAADEVILWHDWISGERRLIRRKPIREILRDCGLPIFKRKRRFTRSFSRTRTRWSAAP